MTSKRDRYKERIDQLNRKLTLAQQGLDLLDVILECSSLNGSGLRAIKYAYKSNAGILTHQDLIRFAGFSQSLASLTVRELRGQEVLVQYPGFEHQKIFLLKGHEPYILKAQKKAQEELGVPKVKPVEIKTPKAEQERLNELSKQEAIMADRVRRQEALAALAEKQKLNG